MAKISADSHCVCRKVYNFAHMFEMGADSRSVKKRKVRVECDEDEKSLKEKKQRIEIDRLKKLQCSMILKRLAVHPDGFVFKKPVDARKPIDLEMIKFKLDRALYLGTDEFADDVRLLFSNSILCYPPKNEIHKTAKRLREVFEVNWKSLNERWATEKAKGDGSLITKETEPLKRLKQGSAHKNACHDTLNQAVSMALASKNQLKKPKGYRCLITEKAKGHQSLITKESELKRGSSADKNACPNTLHQAVRTESASKKELKKLKADQSLITEKAKGDESLTTKESEPPRKLKQGSADENACPNTLHQAVTTESASKKGLKKPKQLHFLDTILAAQDRLLNFSGTAEMPRKTQRQAARVSLQQMERTVCIDDNLNSFKELELLCGHSLSYCIGVHPLENLGLFLKDDFIADWDDERLFNGDWDWEEGEILI